MTTRQTPCRLCGDGHTHPGQTTLTLERGSATIVVRGIPAEICDACGEALIDSAILREMHAHADAAIAAGVQMQISDYARARSIA